MENRELKFNDKFLVLIKKGIKNITIRNSPRELGIYKLSNSIEIEVYGCVKVSTCISHDENFISFNSKEINAITTHKDYRRLGFKSHEMAYEYYSSYIKRGIAFIIFYSLTVSSQLKREH